MNKKYKFLFAIIAGAMLTACHPTIYKSSAAYRSFDTEIINQALDGTVTLKVYGEGTDEDDAIEQAMKNAVSEVAFKGISNGNGSKNIPALFRNPNVRLDNRNYFDNFFQSDYRKYVSKMTLDRDMEGFGSRERLNIGVLVKVNINGLRKHFQDDGLLK